MGLLPPAEERGLKGMSVDQKTTSGSSRRGPWSSSRRCPHRFGAATTSGRARCGIRTRSSRGCWTRRVSTPPPSIRRPADALPAGKPASSRRGARTTPWAWHVARTTLRSRAAGVVQYPAGSGLREDLVRVEAEEPVLLGPHLVHEDVVVARLLEALQVLAVELGVGTARNHLGDVFLGDHLH